MKKILTSLLILTLTLTLSPPPPTLQAAPNITAPIAIAVDFHTGEVLYERGASDRWIPASITKAMTAFITYQEMEAGRLALDTPIQVSAAAAAFSSNARVSGAFVPLPKDEYITVDILLQLLMIPSANAAAVVLAEHISGSEAAFVERMNETAESLGMYAEYTNAHGAYVHYSDAYSTAILIREFISCYPDILRITAKQSVHFNGTAYYNTNHLLSNSTIDGFKTGSLRQAGWNHSSTAERNGRRVIAIVMNAADNESRQRQSRILLDYGFAELERREAERAEKARLFFRGRVIPTAPAISRGRLMLPARSVLEVLGYSVQWHNEHKIVILTNENGANISLFVGRSLVSINGTAHRLELPAEEIGDSVFVSMGLVALITDTTYDWNMETGVVRFD